MLDTSLNFKKNNGALSGVGGFRNASLFYRGWFLAFMAVSMGNIGK